MVVLLAFAFLSGVITILSPCILPVLPVVLSGGVGGGRGRPLGVVAGFVASFTAFTLALTALVQALGIPTEALRVAAIVVIVLFGVVMAVPWLRLRVETIASRVAAGGRTAPSGGRSGFIGGLVVGLGLGLVWTPCVGPIMASVITLALTQRVDGGAVLITLAYSLGTSLPMLGIMAGGRALLSRVPALARRSARIQQGFGVLMILVGVAMATGWDRKFQSAVLAAFPGYGAGLTAIEDAAPVRSALAARQPGSSMMMMSAVPGKGAFRAPGEPSAPGVLSDYGQAPEIIAAGPWLNTEGVAAAAGQTAQGGSLPLTLAALRGKVVVLDFWTYSCVNCVRTLPWLRAWDAAYRAKGLVIVGVHTPEFEFEKSSRNVQRAVADLGVTWPVVQDNDYAQWSSYGNRYWPAKYFIDARGRIRYVHYGEGGYAESEAVIRQLLSEAQGAQGASGTPAAGTPLVSRPEPGNLSRTPETYLGSNRANADDGPIARGTGTPIDYAPAGAPRNGQWALSGRWTIAAEYVVPEASGSLQLGFDAKDVFLVIEPEERGAAITVTVDGVAPADTADVRRGILVPSESRMYHLVGLPSAGAHVLTLAVTGRVRLFAFTFG